MHLELQTIGACTIKRKKPWPKVAWVGQANESLLLLDKNRCSILYMKDGRTQKKISSIQSYVGSSRLLTTSSDGSLLCGLNINGVIWLWQKDRNQVYTVPSIGPLQRKGGNIHVDVSNDGSKLLVVLDCTNFYMWRRNNAPPSQKSKVISLNGRWFRVDCSANVVLPELWCKETNVDSVILSGNVLDSTCMTSVAFWDTGERLRVSTAAITEGADIYANNQPFHAEWCSMQIDGHSSGCKPVRSRGALIIRYAHSLPICALAVNQQSVRDTCVLFISPLREGIVRCDLHQLGMTAERQGRNYWIADMKWTYNDLLLSIITKNGCLAIVSRLGEPILISTDGHGVKFSQGRFLPLLPKIIIRSKAQENIPPSDDTSQMSEQSMLRQRYSITCHPRLPIMVLSDGYQVISLELTEQASTRTMALAFLTDSLAALRALTKQHSISFTLKALQKTSQDSQVMDARHRMRKMVHEAADEQKRKMTYEFEQADPLNESSASLGSSLGGTGAPVLDGAIVTFGSTMHQTLVNQQLSAKDCQQLLEHSCRMLTCAWGLLVSSDTWSYEQENVSTAVTTTAVKLVNFLLTRESGEGEQLLTSKSLSAALTYFSALMRMITFDSFTHHLLPGCIKWIYNCANSLLSKPELKIKLRSMMAGAAFSLVKFSEEVINRTYLLLPTTKFSGSLPVELQQTSFQLLTHSYATTEACIPSTDADTMKDDNDEKTLCLISDRQTHPGGRLAPVWNLLQSHVSSLYADFLKGKHKKKSLMMLRTLLSTIQARNKQVFYKLPRTNDGDKLYLSGFKMAAISEWKQVYQALPDHHQTGSRGSALLHSVLYTQLLQYDVHSALQFIEQLIQDSTDTDYPLADKVTMSSLRVLRLKSVRHIVQTMARFMALYFTNGDLYVYPPHYPQPLIPLYSQTQAVVPVTDIDRERIRVSVMEQGLADVWCIATTVRYLLLSGLMSELVWFCDEMGDWKTSLSLGIISDSHRTTMRHFKRLTVHSVLPESLRPEAVINKVITQMFAARNVVEKSEDLNETIEPVSIDGDKDISSMSNLIHDIMLPAAIFSLEALSSALTKLWSKLKLCAQKCNTFVPDDVYLPAPALFCVQPTVLEMEELSSEAQQELKWRKEFSLLVQYILIILRACHVDLPSCGWLLRHMKEAWQDRRRMNVQEITQLPKSLEEYITFHIPEKDKTNKLLLMIFRNVCSVLWMCHIRDSLSLLMRRSGDIIDQEASRGVEKFEKQLSKRWFPHVEQTLDLCVLYLPFSQFLQCENEICEAIISLAEELPPTEHLADVLASSIPDIDSLAPEVKEKMDILLQTWQTVDRPGRSDQSLSMFYFERCREVERIQIGRSKILAFEEHIFTNTKAARKVGTRLFEYTQPYVDFLDLFFSVAFRGSVPLKGTGHVTALLPCYSHSLQQQHFTDSLIKPAMNKKDKKRSKSEGNLRDKVEDEGSFVDETPQFPVMESKAGLYRLKRQNTLEQRTAKQLKKLGLTDMQTKGSPEGTMSPSLKHGISMGNIAMCRKSVLHSMPSSDLLPQNIKYTEKYERLCTMLQWMEAWSATRISVGTDNRPSTKVEVNTESVVTALMMIEKRLSEGDSRKRKVKPNLPVQRTSERVKPPAAPERSTSPVQRAIANAVEETYRRSFTTHDEEERDREAVLEEMKKQAELPMATTPINQVEQPSSLRSSKEDARKSMSERTHTLTSENTGGTNNFILEDSATTVWSSASLPNLSANSTDPTTDKSRQKDWRSSPDPGQLSPVTPTRGHRSGGKHSSRSRQSDDTPRGGASSGTFSIKSTGDTSSWHTESTIKSKKSRKSSRQKETASSADTMIPQQSIQQSMIGAQDIGAQLQNIVRDEMRRIVQLQHQGLSQMLGALGGGEPYTGQSMYGSVSTAQDKQTQSTLPRATSSLKIEDLAPDRSSITAQTSMRDYGQSEGVTLPPISNLMDEMQKLQGNQRRQPDSVKIPLLSVRQAWLPPPDLQEPLPAAEVKPHVKKVGPIPLLNIHWSQAQEQAFQVPSYPLIHVHQQKDTEPVPVVAAGPEQLRQFDHKKQQREQLKQEISMRFLRKETEAHQARQQKELGRQLLKVDMHYQPEELMAKVESPHKKRSHSKRRVKKDRKDNLKTHRKQAKKMTEEELAGSDDVIKSGVKVIEVCGHPEEVNDHVIEDQVPDGKTEDEPERQPGDAVVKDHGFALTPGMFDEYLEKQDDWGAAADTFAKIQYKAATGLQVQAPQLHDVGVMTEEVETPSPAKPEYTPSQVNDGANILPPEIFCQLNFNDGKAVTTSDSQNKTPVKPARAYLSVVDVNADSFKDIPLVPDPSTTPSKQLESTDTMKEESENFASVQYKMAMEIAGTPQKEAIVDEDTGRGDFVTRQLLGNKSNDPADYVMPSKLRLLHPMPKNKRKAAMAKKLISMDDQLAAIEHLRHNMEAQLQNTKLLLSTAEEIAETQAQSMLKPSTVQEMLESQGEFITTLEPNDEELTMEELGKKSSGPVRRTPSPTHQSPGQPIKSSSRMEVSGLSDISGLQDLVGSMVERGDLNLTDLGLGRSLGGMSEGEILQTFRSLAKSQAASPHQNTNRKQEIKEWMPAHQAAVREAYQQEIESARKPERKPYQTANKNKTGLTNKVKMSKMEKERLARRAERDQYASSMRMRNAEQQIAIMINDEEDMKKMQQKSLKIQKTKTPKTKETTTINKESSKGVTRRGLPSAVASVGNMTARPAGRQSVAGMTASTPAMREAEKIYGSTRLYYQPYVKQGKRELKSYTQRLKELKPQSPRVNTRPAHGRTMQEVTRRGMKPRPLAHKPQTYTQQLQHINQNAPRSARHRDAYGPETKTMLKSPKMRMQGRSRPYASPYRDEESSSLNSWNNSESINRILYSTRHTANDVTDFTDDEISDLENLAAAGLAEMMTDRTGSEQSVIDWDVVDQMIAGFSSDRSTVPSYY